MILSQLRRLTGGVRGSEKLNILNKHIWKIIDAYKDKAVEDFTSYEEGSPIPRVTTENYYESLQLNEPDLFELKDSNDQDDQFIFLYSLIIQLTNDCFSPSDADACHLKGFIELVNKELIQINPRFFFKDGTFNGLDLDYKSRKRLARYVANNYYQEWDKGGIGIYDDSPNNIIDYIIWEALDHKYLGDKNLFKDGTDRELSEFYYYFKDYLSILDDSTHPSKDIISKIILSLDVIRGEERFDMEFDIEPDKKPELIINNGNDNLIKLSNYQLRFLSKLRDEYPNSVSRDDLKNHIYSLDLKEAMAQRKAFTPENEREFYAEKDQAFKALPKAIREKLNKVGIDPSLVFAGSQNQGYYLTQKIR
jgi:hypothetical protein